MREVAECHLQTLSPITIPRGSRVSCWVRSDAVKSADATLKGMALQDQLPPGFLGVVVGIVAPAGNCGAG
jgi:hypothetical protein